MGLTTLPSSLPRSGSRATRCGTASVASDGMPRSVSEARESGLLEPASLHPSIDPDSMHRLRGSCVEACPENEVLGMIEGLRGAGPAQRLYRARRLPYRMSVGLDRAGLRHRATRRRYTGALAAVRDQRPRDLHRGRAGRDGTDPQCGGARAPGGREPSPSADRSRDDAVLDLLIVGAGPAGFSASLAAMQHGLRFVTLEQETLGGSVAHYPRGKLVMTLPVRLPLIGKVPFRETTKGTAAAVLEGGGTAGPDWRCVTESGWKG